MAFAQNNKIYVLGSGQEVGRSAILLECEKNILLDCGIKVRDQELGVAGFPRIPKNLKIDATIISHAHLDHSGFLPAISDRTLFFGTPPTQGLSELLIKDAKKVDPTLPYGIHDIERANRNFILIPYNLEHKINDGIKFSLHDAGHIPGAAITELHVNGKKVVYTADFKLEETKLQKSAEAIEDVDVLIIESTYAQREHPNRKETEKRMCKKIEETLNAGGNVLLPTFAVGRTQEIALILFAHDVELPIYVDGMGNKASQIIQNYGGYVKNPTILREALKNLNQVGKDKSIPFREPSVIIATAGMLEGGPAIGYLLALQKRYNEKQIPAFVGFTGYCLEETNGWYLQNKQMIYLKKKAQKKSKPLQVNLPVELFHLSAHAGKKDLYTFISKANPEKIICVHGDHCEEFANDLRTLGYDAVAPKNDEYIEF